MRRKKKFGVAAGAGSARYVVKGIAEVEAVVRFGGSGMEMGEGGSCYSFKIHHQRWPLL